METYTDNCTDCHHQVEFLPIGCCGSPDPAVKHGCEEKQKEFLLGLVAEREYELSVESRKAA